MRSKLEMWSEEESASRVCRCLGKNFQFLVVMGSPIDLCRRVCFNTLKNILFVILRSGSREPILANSLGFVGSVSLVFVCFLS